MAKRYERGDRKHIIYFVRPNELSNWSRGDVGTRILNILSRASEAGSPTNRSGSDKTRGQGSFGPLKRNEPHTWFAFFTKTGWAWHVTIYMTAPAILQFRNTVWNTWLFWLIKSCKFKYRNISLYFWSFPIKVSPKVNLVVLCFDRWVIFNGKICNYSKDTVPRSCNL